MFAKSLTPLLNVTDVEENFQWFEKLGWKRGGILAFPEIWRCFLKIAYLSH